ncbi:BPTI/Kunitz domain-containing protein 5-like [Drosophila obscura]|uniref:BPTI/Kunitz domain-containing protein 5-like n=1 Tax=Drosophila obscura TaxID=7282 RepID=UPI000BA05973|nr:BPTI/Kunitz domain-containing protein 5-like [Drosophila obscura]
MVKLTLHIVVLSLLLCRIGADNPPNSANRLLVCTQPKSYGGCSEMQVRWYFDPQYNKCRAFHYSGCGGNSNVFVLQSECINYCINPDYDEMK